jgi:hypothetical protein
MADRHGPLRTAMGRFVERGNDGLVSHSAVVFDAADVGLSDVPLGMLDGEPTVDGENVSLVAAACCAKVEIKLAARHGFDESMLLVPGEALGVETIVPLDEAFVLSLADCLPAQNWVPVTDGDGPITAGGDWLARGSAIEKIELSVEKVERARRVIVPTGPRPFEEIFGADPSEVSARPVEDSERFDPEDVLMVMPGDNVSSNWPEDAGTPPAELDVREARPRPAPMGGVSFGVAVLSTPTAEVLGNAVNPLAAASTEALLEHDAVGRLLEQAGFGEGTAIEVVVGPERVTPQEGPPTATLLGTDTDIESFVGMLGGDAEGWGVGVHVVSGDGDGDDHLIVVGLHRHPLGPVDDGIDILRESDAIVEARKLVAETAAELSVR